MHGHNTNKRKLLSIFLLFITAAVIGITGATVIHKLTLENPIKTPTVTGEIEEKNEGNVKNAVFTNTGEADVFLRVAYAESWTYQPKDTDGKPAGVSILLPNKGNLNDSSNTPDSIAKPTWTGRDNDWIDGKDGWWYYKKVLPSGEKTSEFVKEVDFSNVLKAEDERYKTAEYQLHFTMEVVQCSADRKVSQDAIDKVFGEGKVTLPPNWSKDINPIPWMGKTLESGTNSPGSGSN